jgi:hypothetical protein
VGEREEAVGLKANPDLTDEEHHRALSLHEAAHMVTAIALGFSPVRVWMNLDRTQLHLQGHTDVAGTSSAQYSATWVSAGAVAEERAVRDMGYDERTHPGFFANCYTFNAFEDNAMVEDTHRRWHGHPQVFDSKERAFADARLLVYDGHLWEAIEALAAELRLNHGPDRGLDAQRVRDVLAPYRVEWSVQERGLGIWTPPGSLGDSDLWWPGELEEMPYDRVPDEFADGADLRALADDPGSWSLEERGVGDITRLDSPGGFPHAAAGRPGPRREASGAAAAEQVRLVTGDSRLALPGRTARGPRAEGTAARPTAAAGRRNESAGEGRRSL